MYIKKTMQFITTEGPMVGHSGLRASITYLYPINRITSSLSNLLQIPTAGFQYFVFQHCPKISEIVDTVNIEVAWLLFTIMTTKLNRFRNVGNIIRQTNHVYSISMCIWLYLVHSA